MSSWIINYFIKQTCWDDHVQKDLELIRVIGCDEVGKGRQSCRKFNED